MRDQVKNWTDFAVDFIRLGRGGFVELPLDNVWLGVSIENKKHGWPRVRCLKGTPASVRFLSVEPLLEDVTPLRLDGIHWVIVGGESGHGARPMHADWPRSLRDQCQEAGVPFFFKQWGGAKKAAAGRVLDGRTWDEYPQREGTVTK